MSGFPRFAVVGHPNKGKSSIVATLTQDDTVAIAMEPGTTHHSHTYPLCVDGETLYELIDTPGFQRPRQVLAWLHAHSQDAADRPDTVRAFVIQHRDNPRYHDECELLAPILEGAGILHVVDGSVPYSGEQEAEMEILRWTGRPSLALINRIGRDDHGDTWMAALGQYFQIVRHFDAVRAPFEEHLGLLRSFGELAPAWRAPLERAAHHLREQRQHRDRQALTQIASALGEMLAHTETAISHDDRSDGTPLQQRWRDWQRRREQRLRQDIQQLYRYHRLQRRESEPQWHDEDLFSEQARRAWGMSHTYLATAGFGAGALGGAGVDALAAGHTLGAGALIGGVLGAAGSVYYGSRYGRQYAARLDRLKLGRLSPGGRELRFGPVRDPQFGYVALGRALQHAWQVAHRNHAGQGPLTVDDSHNDWLQHLPRPQRAALQKALLAPPRHAGDHRRHRALEKAVITAGEAFRIWHESR